MENSIPVSGSRGTDSESELAAEVSTETGGITETERGEVETIGPATIVIEPAKEDIEDADEVEGQVTLAVKVTKKRPPTKRDEATATGYKPRYSAPTRRPVVKRPASFNPLAWVADGVTGAIEEARHNDLGMSQEFWTHLYAVRREGLLTARALVESLIARLESKGDEQEERKQRRERRGSVDIDF